jgi:hypothetical protein
MATIVRLHKTFPLSLRSLTCLRVAYDRDINFNNYSDAYPGFGYNFTGNYGFDSYPDVAARYRPYICASPDVRSRYFDDRYLQYGDLAGMSPQFSPFTHQRGSSLAGQPTRINSGWTEILRESCQLLSFVRNDLTRTYVMPQ